MSDLERVTKTAYGMITHYGMNSKVGNVSFNDPKGEYGYQRPYSDKTAELIDDEVRKLIEPSQLEKLNLPTSFANRYKIAKIYEGQNWDKSIRSPLTEQGVNVNEGDYLIALNGKEVTLNNNPYEFLENTADKHIEIVVNAEAKTDGARTSMIEPITSELGLMYLNWVNERRALVDKLSGGKIGYIHVPNTAIEGNHELVKGMYAYHNKGALIINDR